MLNQEIIKKDFPIFEHHPELVYLDSAATAQKPKVVLEALQTYYTKHCANVSRGLYPLAETTTEAVQKARERIAHFIDSDVEGTIFIASATHGINLVATGLREKLGSENNIVVTAVEHHSNFLPWKELARKTGAEFRVAKPNIDGILSAENILPLIDEHTRIVAFTAISNVVGIVNPIKKIVQAIRAQDPEILILVDAAQAVGHIPVSVKEWGTDYLVFSGHKVFGPTGIGVLAGKKQSLELLGAINVGGGTVLNPLSSPVEYKKLPESLEGGTPNIAGILGLGAAIQYVEKIGLENIHQHEHKLITFAEKRLQEAFGEKVTILGGETKAERAGILSFTIDGIHPHDLSHLLGEEGICIRAGEHCARPLHRVLNLPASARISVSIYNTKEDIKELITSIKKSIDVFAT